MEPEENLEVIEESVEDGFEEGLPRGVNVPKKKREMSEKQREALKAAREKAIAKRKELGEISKKEHEIEKKMKMIQLNKRKKKVEKKLEKLSKDESDYSSSDESDYSSSDEEIIVKKKSNKKYVATKRPVERKPQAPIMQDEPKKESIDLEYTKEMLKKKILNEQLANAYASLFGKSLN